MAVSGLDRGQRKANLIRRGDYASALFQRFCEMMDRLGPRARLLDLGPSTPENVVYWARRGHAVAALDYIGHHANGSEHPLERFEDGHFGGILGWTVLSHLPSDEAIQLMGQLERVIQPGGLLFAIFDGDGQQVPPARRYRIVSGARLAFEPIDRNAPRPVVTGEIEVLFHAFKPARLTVMRHGSREALGSFPLHE